MDYKNSDRVAIDTIKAKHTFRILPIKVGALCKLYLFQYFY